MGKDKQCDFEVLYSLREVDFIKERIVRVLICFRKN